MSPFLSTYLDLVRVCAALAVVLSHVGTRRISGGIGWQAIPYGAQAVDVFFVLSGYVIAWAAAERERGKWSFTTARLGRLYSVMVPAALLTFALDALGRWLQPGVYDALPAYAPGHVPLWQQAAAGLLFVNEVWTFHLPMGSNIPWWSMGYEAPYYLAFGLLWFGPRIWRFVMMAVALLLFGPKVAALAPLWAMGALAYHANRLGLPPRAVAANLALAPLAVWLLLNRFMPLMPDYPAPPPLRAETLQDLAVGTLFAVHLLGVGALARQVGPLPAPVSRAVGWLAGRSFTLYLLHYPVLLCLRAAQLRFAPGLSPALLAPVTLLIVLAVAQVTERRKLAWRRMFAAAVRRTMLPPASQT